METIQKLFDDTKIIIHDRCRCCGEIDFISKNISINNCWEPNVTSVIIELLSKNNNNIFFDIGANIGYYSLISSKYCKKIYAFDANSKNIDMLEKSIILNNINNIETFCCAIVDDEQKFFKTSVLHEHNVGSLRVEETNKDNSNIKSIKLDNFIQDNNIDKIDLIKIDIEGAEMLCLGGLINSLKLNIIDNIIIEVTPAWGKKEAYEILKLLSNSNYILYDIGLNETGKYEQKKVLINNITNIEELIKKVHIQTNILAKKYDFNRNINI